MTYPNKQWQGTYIRCEEAGDHGGRDGGDDAASVTDAEHRTYIPSTWWDCWIINSIVSIHVLCKPSSIVLSSWTLYTHDNVLLNKT